MYGPDISSSKLYELYPKIYYYAGYKLVKVQLLAVD